MPVRLKSFELQGYKTFASRTNFEFASTVTAIVGPNGSGKSNLSDAMRWVLGEQSFSLLRAKKTEDLIFSGSEQRPRASMASATIVFDNTEGWLPIDFSEVAITRRAYRDGENEYLLNNQRVRLRDVSELLAQSGLAERTYTIIGQGLVDMALALKAEERRRLFEEAAGIGLHRSRREEALRRLDTTRRNLERVQDILAELQPRLRSLERQARRAQEYEQVKADLRLVLRDWYGFHWHRAQKELAEAREVARSRELILERARQEQADQAHTLAVCTQAINDLRGRLNAWHRQSAQLHTRWEALSREQAVAEERGRALNEQRRDFSRELVRLEGEQALSQERLAEAISERAQLNQELAEARLQLTAARQALEEQQAQWMKLEEEAQETRQELSELTARQAHLQARLAERQVYQERQGTLLQEIAQVIIRDENSLLVAEKELAEAARLWQESRDQRQDGERRLSDLHQRLGEVESLWRQAENRRASLDAQVARLEAQNGVLEAAERDLTGYSSGARILIQAARETPIAGIRGVLGAFLEVPAEIEVAITAALGEFADAVLLDQASEEIFEILHSQKARAALLPLTEIHPAQPLSTLQAMDGVLGIAADLVKSPNELDLAVRLLLGDVWVVKDRSTARAVMETLRKTSEHHPGVQFRVVTLQGEIFYSSGALLAGVEGGVDSSGAQTPATLLSRPRLLRELRAQIAQLKDQLISLAGQIAGLEKDRNELHEQQARLAQEFQQVQVHEQSRRTLYEQADLAVEKARRQLQWRREERLRLEAERGRVSEEIAEISMQLAQMEGQVAQTRQKLQGYTEQLARLSIEECQTRLSHWNTRVAVVERAVAEAGKRQEERQAALDRARRATATLQSRLADLQSAMEKLESEKAIHRQEEGQVSEQIESLRLLIEPAETELEKAEQEQAQLQTAEAAARQNLSLAEHHHAQARITLARRQETLDSLRRRIEDDFGLVAFEYAEEISGQATLPLDGMVEQLPIVRDLSPEIEDTIKRQRAQLRRMGPVNPEAQAEYHQVKERFEFLTTQITDLTQAESDIRQVIAELDHLMDREFRKTFEAVAEEFRDIFSRLFGGGSARLLLTDPEDLTGTGIEIEARLPGRRTQSLSLLSGGERSLTATALIFALLKVSPTPFCVLDEVDAMLDETNVGRFRDLLRELSQNTQFVVVTHNRNTVQVADVIYGVTMGRDSASQVLSLKLDEVDRVVSDTAS